MTTKLQFAIKTQNFPVTNIERLSNFFFEASLAVLFFQLFVVPFHYYWLKAPFFIIIAAIITLKSFKRSRTIVNKKFRGFPILLMVYWYVFLGVFFTLLGAQKAPANFLFYICSLYIIFPIVWGYIAYNLERKHILLIYKVLIVSTVIISVYVISYYLSRVGISNWSLISFIAKVNIAQNANVVDGIAAVNLVSISTLVFAVPFMISLVTLPIGPQLIWSDKRIYIPIILLAMIAIVISGRRAIVITILLAFLFSFFLSMFLPNQDKIRLIGKNTFYISLLTISLYLLSSVVFSGLQIDLGNYITYVLSTLLETDHIRSAQSQLLIKGWFESPFLGVGHGVPTEMVRDSIKPWRYEMSYLSLLFHTGILGVLSYSIGILFIYVIGIYIIRQGGKSALLMICQLSGLTSMLIAYWGNPYFDALDILWTIFLPVAYINTNYYTQVEA